MSIQFWSKIGYDSPFGDRHIWLLPRWRRNAWLTVAAVVICLRECCCSACGGGRFFSGGCWTPLHDGFGSLHGGGDAACVVGRLQRQPC
jgi:hypothetical protein